MLSCCRSETATSFRRHSLPAGLWLALSWCLASAAWGQGQPLTFSAIGDIPYGSTSGFEGFVDDHNLFSPSEFFVHVGDIKSGSTSCTESRYSTVSNIMGRLAVPTFVLPGDNEWNDCPDPDQAWQFWETYFMGFEQSFCGLPAVEAQVVRPENFAFLRDGVLFVGLNVVGGTVHDSAEWDTRLQQDADWVDYQFAQKGDQARAAVVFGHAGRSSSRGIFFDQFEASSAVFGKPVLYIQGDDHGWVYDNPFPEPNMARVTIEKDDPPLQVTVSMDPGDPWILERDPWPAGTAVLNRPPCVEAGPDVTLDLGAGTDLFGFVTDDGVPVGGGVSLTWSQVAGPAPAVIADASAALTSVAFPSPGSYLLRLTADDGELVSLDELAVEVQGPPGPTLVVGDASVTEGDGASVQAVFDVDLLAGTGDAVSVAYTTVDGTAVAGSDYLSASGNLSFSGSTTQRTVSVSVLGDLETEGPETFLLNLSNASGAQITDGVGTGLILDDDVPSPPVVDSFAPASGPAGAPVSVIGQSFSGVTSVTFDGTPAAFSVASDTRIDTAVPAGASSGVIALTNGAGSGASASAFVVEFALAVDTTGSGTVAQQPPSPNGYYPQGTPVTLTPLPAAGWSFQAWSGDLAGSDAPATITVNADTAVQATFLEGSALPVSLSAAIASGNDDAEERLSSGAVNLTSSDLELVEDKGRSQIVGLRFADLAIPQGATILSARVQFTTDEVTTAATAVEIRGQAADHAAPFQAVGFDVSSRPTTAAAASWNPPSWPAIGAAGDDQRTPDLAAVVQEIVARPGWAPGNALVLVVTGSGVRTADSQNGAAPGAAPTLEVVYLDVPDLENPSTPQNLVSPTQTETAISLAWDAATDDVGVTGYRVYGPNGIAEVTGTSHVETGLSPNTTYDFQVSARDAAGNESDLSTGLSVATAAPDLENPSTPTNLTSPAQTGTSIDLAWDAATDNVGVTGYRVYGPGGAIDVAGPSHVETGLTPSTTYNFQVSARDAAGNESEPTPLLSVSTGAAAPVSVSVAIASGNDDAEETVASGAVNLTSSDLELVEDKGSAQIVGMRFADLAIPQGATILSARVQFTTDEVTTAATAVEIRGQAADHAAPFQNSSFDVSARPTTAAAASWNPPSWPAIGAAGDDQRTPDLAAVVQEIVARPGWAPGNAVVLVVTGSGVRTADSQNGAAPGAAPTLEVVYLDVPDLENPSTPENLVSPIQTGGSISLAWDAATDDVGVTGYRVYGPNGIAEVTGTSHVETGLSPNTTYDFQVTARDAAGNESDPTPSLSVQTGASSPESLSVRIANGDDDAEERLSTGAVKLTSSDLELVEDKSRPQLVGLRFTGVGLPPGATITAAHLQFATDEAQNVATSLVIRAQAAGDAPAFSSASASLSTRPTTGASAAWDPAAWPLVGEAGAAQRSDDLSAVLQEIVERPDWSAGNALVLLISGSGSRVAESYDGSPATAAELSVDYLP